MKNGLKGPLLYEKVVEEIYTLIDTKEVKPGEKFPSERELVDRWQVSRNVLREGFHVLESRGLVISRQGLGRFLRAIPVDESKESSSRNISKYSLLELYVVRQTLDMKCVELVVEQVTDEDIAEIEALYLSLAEKFKSRLYTSGEFELHKLYGEKCGNIFLANMLELCLKSIVEMFECSFYDVLLEHDLETYLADHREIIACIKRRDKKGAIDMMKRHTDRSIEYLRRLG